MNDHDQHAVAAAGAMTEALETLERARGHLYSFHQLVGEADFKLDEVLDGLRELGQTELADQLQRELVGRDVLPGRWTFQIMEEGSTTATTPVLPAAERKGRLRDALTERPGVTCGGGAD